MRGREFLKRWGPALLLMAGIFLVSAQPKGVVPDFGGVDRPVKKAGHLVAYALLGVTYLRGLAYHRRAGWKQATAAVVLAALYGATDEYHQSFVPGRMAGVSDVVIDTLGAFAGVSLALGWRNGWYRRRFRRDEAATQTPARPGPPLSTRSRR